MSDISVVKNVSLKDFCTYKIGGVAKKVVRVGDVEGLRRVMGLDGKKVIIGRGSKVLFSDEGFDGVVVVMGGERLKFFSENDAVFTSFDTHNMMKNIDSMIYNMDFFGVYAESGVFLPKLGRECLKRGLSGLEWMVGIPGSIGGAVWMNAGAHGGDMASVIEWVEIFRDGEVVRVPGEECGFGYRRSRFVDGDIVLGACFRLAEGDKGDIEMKMAEYVKKRKTAQPAGRSCGSVFKAVRLEGGVVPAWELIDNCGLKRVKIGGAEISGKHANFIMNVKNAKAEDVRALIRLIKAEVYLKYGIKLEEEIVFM
ncbi:MAG: UDP-N-acetylmuramate dehydrogenase [Firmicutes bacterium]|nr:UDP-N-acetylmuramate dehydrogenase [Bacillota bacterium]